jgi:hypothetical protein
MIRAPKDFGERHSRLAWVSAALIGATTVAFWTVFFLTYESPRTWQVALTLYGLLLLCGFGFVTLTYHWNAADAYNPGSMASEEDLWRALDDREPTVVYLRNFSSEGGYVNTALPPRFHAPELITPVSRVPFMSVTHSSLESGLWETLHNDAELFAIENIASNTVPWFKTVRCSNDRWKDVVTRAVSGASLIVLAIESETDGIEFEVDLILRTAIAKTWVIVVPDIVPKLQMRWPALLRNSPVTTILPVRRLRQASDHVPWPSRSELHAKFPELARRVAAEPSIRVERHNTETPIAHVPADPSSAPTREGSNRGLRL